MTNTTVSVLSLIPKGRDNAITRTQLCSRLDLPDRDIRRHIQAARDEGCLILNDQSGKGYYIADEQDIPALRQSYRQERGRALAILKRLKTMRRILKAAGALDEKGGAG